MLTQTPFDGTGSHFSGMSKTPIPKSFPSRLKAKSIIHVLSPMAKTINKNKNKKPTSSSGGVRYRKHLIGRHTLAKEDDQI
jgi:hypothetical protein